MLMRRGTAVAGIGLLLAVVAGCSSGSTGSVAPPPFAGPSATTGNPVPPATPTAGQPPASTPAPAPPPSRCTTAELTGSLGPAGAGAGSVFVTILFTNKGNRTCELAGYPGVSYVAGDDGHQVGPAAARSGPAGGVVSLAPGKAAAAKLQLANVQNFPTADCQPTPVRGLRIYPPDETSAMFLPRDGTGCAKTPPGPSQQLQIQAVQLG